VRRCRPDRSSRLAGVVHEVSAARPRLIALFLLVRAPFERRALLYEEGVFADLAVNRVHGPKYCLVGRFDGAEVREGIDRPAPMYEAFRALGAAASAFIGRDLPTEVIAPRLRVLIKMAAYRVEIALLRCVTPH